MSLSIETSISIMRTPTDTFHRFFGEMERWWPREYTWGNEVMEAIGIEPCVGGLCFELGPYGFRTDWGRVLEWDEPHRVKLSWQISPRREPVPNPANASIVEIHFTPEGPGSTRVTLTHEEFEHHGDGAAEYRAAMASQHGWPFILSRYAAIV